jgi:hypothetical protein
MRNSLIPSGDDDGFNNVPLTGRGAMRGSPITYNAVDGNYWRDRVDVVNGEKLVVLACRRGYQYWPLDGSAPQLLLDEPGAPHPERSAFGDQDESKWRDGPNLSDRSLCRYLGAVLRQSMLIPEEAAPLFRDDVAPRNGMMPPPDSEMIAPP